MTGKLPAALTGAVLTYLGVTAASPDVVLLERLIIAYGRCVPWESASRIVRRAGCRDAAGCPRWSEQFWEEAIGSGTGGTCFESNHAFISLLKSLGYDAYLTINNMGDTVGCHTAVVVHYNGCRWLIDAGYPVYAVLPLDPRQITRRSTPWLDYTAEPLGDDHYVISCSAEGRPYLFTLIDRPVGDELYRRATAADYGETGLFLQRLIFHKLVDGDIWRFDGDNRPYHLQQFHAGQRIDHPITDTLASRLSQHFGIANSIVEEALSILQLPAES